MFSARKPFWPRPIRASQRATVGEVLDEGPFFHGTKAELRAGDLLRAGFNSNYRPEVVMNHIYFTALRDGAGLAAEIAALDGSTPHVYEVEPTGPFENDPNVTDWTRLTPEALQTWKDRLAELRADERGQIIN